MRVRFGYYKDGKKAAVTTSYDDGQVFDLQLLELFNKYGIKGTFNLNSSKLDCEGFVTTEAVRTAYAGHEVAVHTLTHPYLERVPVAEQLYEVLEDRKNLEAITGNPVAGMAYPYGTYSEEVIRTLETAGIVYSRTVKATASLNPPERFLTWHPTCHHSDPKLLKYCERLLREKERQNMPLLYVWGHSYEFPRDDQWGMMEEFCATVGGNEEIWYATNIEIYDYMTALRRLRFSTDRTVVTNLSGVDVWLSVDKEPVRVPAGATVKLN